jgi:hypothetical protein
MRRTKTGTTARAAAVIALPLAASLLAACSSSSTTAATAPASTGPASSSAATAPASPAAADSPSATPAAPTTFAATGTAIDSQGDKATVSVSIGKPVPQLSLNQADLTACGIAGELSYDADQTMAIPVQLTATLTSSIATTVILSMDGTNVVAPGGNANGNGNPPTWATEGDNSTCGNSSGGVVALEWDNLAPDQPVTWSGWLLDPGVITPDDTSGSAVNQVFFLEPVVNFGSGGSADLVADAAHSQNLVNCDAGVQGGPVIAVDLGVARANGCTTYTGS